MLTVQEVYDTARGLPPAERLRLASLLLDDLVQSPELAALAATAYQSDWSEEDLREASQRSLRYAAQIYGDEDNLLPAEPNNA